jgi:Caspase domain
MPPPMMMPTGPRTIAVAVPWDPSRTRVFAVGMCSYKGKKEPDFDPDLRQDGKFIETLIERGVPKANVVFLQDKQASIENVRRSLDAHMAASRPEETFLFFFSGHGCRGEEDTNAGMLQLCFYDGEFSAADLYSTIEAKFRGATAMLLVDCCFSGFLALEAPRRAGRVAYGVIASQMAQQLATGAWTFTEALIDGFGQKLAVDISGDGVLLFSELATYTEGKLASEAGQLSLSAAVNGFPSLYVIGTAKPRAGPIVPPAFGVLYPPGTRLKVADPEAEENEEGDEDKEPAKRGATVLAARYGVHLVRYDGLGEIADAWLGHDEIELDDPKAAAELAVAADPASATEIPEIPLAAAEALAASLRPGDRVEAMWGPDPESYPGFYKGRIISISKGGYHVRYLEDDTEDDVRSESMRAHKGAKAGDGVFSVGQKIEALWENGEDSDYPGYFKAEVLEVIGPLVSVAYDDGTTADVRVAGVRRFGTLV